MPIPKVIYQSWKHSEKDLHPVLRQHRENMKYINPDYVYCLFTDREMDIWVYENFAHVPDIVECYDQLNIMVARVDFWRYLVLYKNGGVYVDMDSEITLPLSGLIRPEDQAIISMEGCPTSYVQWALIFEANHPILARTIEIVVDNIKNNRYPGEIDNMTGPTAYTRAINEFARSVGFNLIHDADPKKREEYKTEDGTQFRIEGVNYNGFIKFKHEYSRLLYIDTMEWRMEQKIIPLLRGS